MKNDNALTNERGSGRGSGSEKQNPFLVCRRICGGRVMKKPKYHYVARVMHIFLDARQMADVLYDWRVSDDSTFLNTFCEKATIFCVKTVWLDFWLLLTWKFSVWKLLTVCVSKAAKNGHMFKLWARFSSFDCNVLRTYTALQHSHFTPSLLWRK